MTDNPVFNSPELRQAYSDTKADLESLRTNLDLVSRDIKALEEMLEKNGIRIPVRVGLSDEFTSTHSCCILSWQECSTSKRWRIIYEQTDYLPNGDFGGQTIKPLIETSAGTRIVVYKHLPEFLHSIAQVVKVEPLKNRIDTEEFDFGPGEDIEFDDPPKQDPK